MLKNENYKIRIIPTNFENGINIVGFNFSPRFLLEGSLLAIFLFAITTYTLVFEFKLPISNVLGIIIAISFSAFFLGVKGLNDEPISVFILNVNKTRKSKIVAYYNPRVKREIKSFVHERNEEVLPKEKLNNGLVKIKTKLQKRSELKAKEIMELRQKATQLYFLDDEGYIEKPREYMNAKERKEYDKLQLKKQKELLKIAKRRERENRINGQ